MAIGKSKISDIDFASMESAVGKSMELTDMRENFDAQVKALLSAKDLLEETAQALMDAKADMNTARLRLDNAAANANAAADTIGGKVELLCTSFRKLAYALAIDIIQKALLSSPSSEG